MKRILPFCLAVAVLAVVWLNLDAQVAQTSLSVSIAGWEKIQTPTAKYSTSGFKEARCTAGKKVVGGGYHIVGANQSVGFASAGFAVVINRPSADDAGWYVGWYADTDSDNFWVNIYAICAKA